MERGRVGILPSRASSNNLPYSHEVPLLKGSTVCEECHTTFGACSRSWVYQKPAVCQVPSTKGGRQVKTTDDSGLLLHCGFCVDDTDSKESTGNK